MAEPQTAPVAPEDDDKAMMEPMTAPASAAGPTVPRASAPFVPATAPFMAPEGGAINPPLAGDYAAANNRSVGGGDNSYSARTSLSFDKPPESAVATVSAWSRRARQLLDRTVPLVMERWLFTLGLLIMYLVRALFFIDGWYIVTYALGIYLLNVGIGFITPKDLDDLETLDGPALPSTRRDEEESRPFMRKLPEFQAWMATTRGVMFAFFATFFELFNIPVFWPILLIYFIALLVMTSKQQIKQMRRYKYLPWNWGKKVYKGRS